MTTKTFPLREILSVTTSRALGTPLGDGNGMDGVYKVMNHTLNDDFSTLGLLRAAEPCRSHILGQYPELEQLNYRLVELDEMMEVAEANGGDRIDAINTWINMCIYMWGYEKEYAIESVE